MSANLDLVRSIVADWERGDFSRADWADGEIEFAWVGGPDPSSWTGLAGMVEGVREFLSAWEDFRVEPEQFREIDDERVLVLVRHGGRAKTGELDLGGMAGGASVFRIRDGKVTRLLNYLERERALADLGLEE